MTGQKGKTESRRRFIGRMGAAGASLAFLRPTRMAFSKESSHGSASRDRPNIIVFVTDDQRWDTMGCVGNPIIQTPNLDRLAQEGVLFMQNFCTTSICMSSRASIFTGMYTRRHQINSFQQPLSPELLAQTYPVLLRKGRYRTGFVGKWGLGGPLPKEDFDYFEGFSGQGQYFQEINGKNVHLTQLLTERALEFLRGCSREQPFCLSVSFKAPHVQDGHPDPFRYDPIYENLYQDTEIPVPTTASAKHFQALPEFIRTSEGRVRWERRFATPRLFQKSVKAYYRLITGADAALGKAMAILDQFKLSENTVILWTSDNGFFLGEHGLAGKWLMHEESIRTPLIIRDPRLPSNRRGSRCEEMTLNIDIAPTLLTMAGANVPAAVQGQDLQPLLEGQPIAWRQDFFYEHLFEHARIPKCEGIRTKRWKYIRYIQQEPLYEELYDLEKDPQETQNVVGRKENDAVVASLRKRWRELRDELV